MAVSLGTVYTSNFIKEIKAIMPLLILEADY